MKKFLIIAALVLFGAFIACSTSEDEQKIKDRISTLQTAINARDIPEYLACFDNGDSMFLSWVDSLFTGAFPVGYSCSFGDVTVLSSTATCPSTTTLNGSTTSHTNVFIMSKSGTDWYIQKWTQDINNVIFFVKQPLAPQ